MNLGGNRGLAAVLGELTAAGRPWLAIDLPGLAGRSRSVPEGCAATLVSVADQGQPPVMINPLEPEPGSGVQAHARRLAELTEAVFGLTGPVAEAVRAGLLRVYADGGWDLVTGAAPPGAEALPPVPAYAQLRRAIVATAHDLGYAASVQAAVRVFLRARLEPLWAGPAGRFLEGGHPADLAALLRGNVLLTGDGLAGADAAAFLTGAVLARAAEWLRAQRRRPPPVTIVVTPASSGRAAAWLAAVTREIAAYGGAVIAAPAAGMSNRAAASNCTRRACSRATTSTPGCGCGR